MGRGHDCSTVVSRYCFAALPNTLDGIRSCCAAYSLSSHHPVGGGGALFDLPIELLSMVFGHVDAYTLFMVLARVSRKFAEAVKQTAAAVFAPHLMFSRPDLMRMSARAMVAVMRRVHSIEQVDLSHCLFQDTSDIQHLEVDLPRMLKLKNTSTLTLAKFNAFTTNSDLDVSSMIGGARVISLDLSRTSISDTEFAHVCATCPQIEVLSVARQASNRRPNLADILSLQHLRHLTCDGVDSIGENGLLQKMQAGLPHLAHLSLRHCDAELSTDDIRAIGGMANLEYLDLFDVSWHVLDSTETVFWLAQLSKLAYLDVGRILADFTEAAASELCGMGQLAALKCGNIYELKTVFLDAISRALRLSELDISYTGVSDLAPLAHMRTLDTLIADGTDVTDASMVCLSGLSVTTLSLENCANLTEQMAAHTLPPRLKHLHVMRNSFDDKTLAVLYTANPHVGANGIHCMWKGAEFVRAVAARGTCTRLSIARGVASFCWLHPLAALGITDLSIPFCRLIDGHLDRIGSLSALTYLCLGHNPAIGNASMAHLPGTLLCLDVAYTSVSVEGVRVVVERCTSIKAMYVHGCTEVAGMNKVLVARRIKTTVHGDCVSLGTFYGS